MEAKPLEILRLERIPDGIAVEFSDGATATYSAVLLRVMMPLARDVNNPWPNVD